LGLVFLLVACRSPETATPIVEQEVTMFKLTSAAFVHGEAIPALYTCDGEDLSPPLSWSGAPEATQSYVLICDDPDAPVGVWDHLILFNIPASTNELPQGIAERTDGSLYGKNSWRRLNYGGPCPPRGVHRYFFKLYALDTNLTLQEGASKREIERAMEGHILARTELVGTYTHR
jgi:Raf kinase inhibitor-like YbhB/YbcL family protein